jgi:hypothetical protein
VLFQRQGAAVDAFLTVDATHPIEGDVDILVEMGDELGTLPDQVPTRLAYWIEQPPSTCGVSFHDVKSPASAYHLFAWENAFFGDATSPLTVAGAIVNTHLDAGDHIAGYPSSWPNYKHFVLTNTSGSSGAAANVSAAQCWNTDAENDSEPASVAHANYAGRDDTTRASEARFPDGVYTIHVIANDLIQDAGPFLEIPVRLENFHPIVCYTNPFAGEILPAGTDEVGGLEITFNERMDTTVAPATILAVNNGATIFGATWLGDFTLSFGLGNLQGGQAYQLRVKATARDLPGTPGNRPLDGNQDGVGGDDLVVPFSVAN